MTQTQFLIILIALIPLLNALTIKICANSEKMLDVFSKLFPLLYFVNLIGIYGNLNRDNSYVTIIEAIRGISLSFDIDEISLKFLFLLNFIWIVFAFYSQRFFQIFQVKNIISLKIFLVLIFAFLNLVIISKNLLTILFFYNCLIILSHFFSLKFLHKNENKFSNIFTFLLYLESTLFFFAIVATFKFAGQIDFVSDGIFSDHLTSWQFGALLILYLGGLFLSIIFPCFLFYRNINLEPIVLYALFFLSYAFAGIYILVKILTFTFGLDILSMMLSGSFFTVIEIVFLLNISLVSAFLLFSKGLKSSFFYLLFQQFSLAIFTTLFWAFFNPSKIQITALSFTLSLTLFFLALSNMVLYLGKSPSKELKGIFYKLKINSVFLVIALLNMVGLFCGIGALEKFFVLKTIIAERLPFSASIYLINFIAIVGFFVKMILPFFKREKIENQTREIKTKQADKLIIQKNDNVINDEIAADIDFDSGLSLSAFTVVILIILSAILYPFFSQFFS
jgi:formate hydrogenlyase subunit 3/multisubunit Na+/H+ antiporter MnhD subunit